MNVNMREFSMALSKVTGISLIRSVSFSEACGDASEITMTFIPSVELMQKVGAEMAESEEKKPSPPPTSEWAFRA